MFSHWRENDIVAFAIQMPSFVSRSTLRRFDGGGLRLWELSLAFSEKLGIDKESKKSKNAFGSTSSRLYVSIH